MGDERGCGVGHAPSRRLSSNRRRRQIERHASMPCSRPPGRRTSDRLRTQGPTGLIVRRRRRRPRSGRVRHGSHDKTGRRSTRAPPPSAHRPPRGVAAAAEASARLRRLHQSSANGGRGQSRREALSSSRRRRRRRRRHVASGSSTAGGTGGGGGAAAVLLREAKEQLDKPALSLFLGIVRDLPNVDAAARSGAELPSHFVDRVHNLFAHAVRAKFLATFLDYPGIRDPPHLFPSAPSCANSSSTRRWRAAGASAKAARPPSRAALGRGGRTVAATAAGQTTSGSSDGGEACSCRRQARPVRASVRASTGEGDAGGRRRRRVGGLVGAHAGPTA